MDWARGLEGMEDGRLLAELGRLVGVSNRVTAELLAHIGEVDARGLYRDEACSSMFVYCVRRLHLSESAAYRRIHVARAARRMPVLFEWVAEGRVHLSGLSLLVPHLTPDNCELVLRRAEHKSKRELEELVAELAPRPDVPARVRRLPRRSAKSLSAAAVSAESSPGAVAAPESGTAAFVLGAAPLGSESVSGGVAAPESGTAGFVLVAAPRGPESAPGAVAAAESGTAGVVLAAAPQGSESPPGAVAASGRRAAPAASGSVKALAPERYAVQFTADKGLRDKLETARELLRHQNPTGDLAMVVERALDVLVERLLNQRFGKTSRPRKAPAAAPRAGSRHVPRSVRRAVFERDGGRCTFVDEGGRRCLERGFLELHHREAFALGGAATAENITLLCRAHNALVAERELGAARGELVVRSRKEGEQERA